MPRKDNTLTGHHIIENGERVGRCIREEHGTFSVYLGRDDEYIGGVAHPSQAVDAIRRYFKRNDTVRRKIRSDIQLFEEMLTQTTHQPSIDRVTRKRNEARAELERLDALDTLRPKSLLTVNDRPTVENE